MMFHSETNSNVIDMEVLEFTSSSAITSHNDTLHREKSKSINIVLNSALAFLFATNVSTVTPSVSQGVVGTSIVHWKLCTEPQSDLKPMSKSASEEDVEADSPNWLASRIEKLQAQSFKRINDPRSKKR